jgi:hypothetical protein
MCSIRRTCVQVRRIGRSEPVQRALTASKFMKKHMVRGAAFGFFPSTINDVAFHHATLNISEIIHVSLDTAVVSSINAVANILLVASKLPL